MPRTRFDKPKPKVPPVDLAWGAVMVRMKQMNITMQELAEITNHHYDTIRATMSKPPIEWSDPMRQDILAALGLKARLVIEDAEDGAK